MSDRTSRPYPLGATVFPDGTNFSVLSASACGMQLVLFDHADDSVAARTIALDPVRDRTAHYWHIFLPGVKPGQLYGYRADGPFDPAAGQRFDAKKILIDPYGKAVAVGANYNRDAACRPGDNAATSMKSVVADLSLYEWENDRPLNRPFSDTVIYELHVAGFTRDPSSGVAEAIRGKYLGLIEKIPYLQSLGITAVELMPVFQFDSQSGPAGLTNYWGYDPVSFFAPHVAYGTRPDDPLACLDEFRTLVKAMHRAGIEVILDVVYNHTDEGNEHGPTICFRGFENNFYYILEDGGAHYADFTGTGNTLKSNHSVVKRMILDSLRHWVSEMHVDGFRFDLASIFSRSISGEPELNAPIIWEIDSDPVLAGTKLIAEAWDTGGLYQVGSFGQDKWKEWNGIFRDDVKHFLKADADTAWKLHERLIGSPDIYGAGHRPRSQSINYIACHDGFTLNDLVSYNQQQGAADFGQDARLNWNCGAEGPSTIPEVEQLRMRQIKNFLAITVLSIGTPMLLMGDEVRRTQQGDSNAYCLDNEVSWFDWNLCQRNGDLFRFVQELIRLRKRFDRGAGGDTVSLEDYLSTAQIKWYGTTLDEPNWSADSHSFAATFVHPESSDVHYMAINSYWNALDFDLPQLPGSASRWLRIMDTSLASPDDIAPVGRQAEVRSSSYTVNPRSIVALHSQALS
jgi:glycogen operon protein